MTTAGTTSLRPYPTLKIDVSCEGTFKCVYGWEKLTYNFAEARCENTGATKFVSLYDVKFELVKVPFQGFNAIVDLVNNVCYTDKDCKPQSLKLLTAYTSANAAAR